MIPPVIENDPEAKVTFIEAMNRDAENYLKEVERLEVIHTKVLMENGASEKDAKRMASKFANEDARFFAQRLRNQNGCNDERKKFA